MYRLFVNNFNNYLKLNYNNLTKNEFRINIAKPLIGMTDINIFRVWKRKNHYEFKELSNLIYEIGNRKNQYHSFDTFSWELWGYGFEGEKNDLFSEEIICEQLKLVDLLLGTHYWYI